MEPKINEPIMTELKKKTQKDYGYRLVSLGPQEIIDLEEIRKAINSRSNPEAIRYLIASWKKEKV